MAVPYEICAATEADIDMLIDFTLREAAEAEGLTLDVESATTGVRGAFGISPQSTYWVATDPGGTMVASTSVVRGWSNFHGAYYWWVQSLYIVPEHRGAGLAEQLLRHLAAASRAAGALDLRLYAHRLNERAIRTYTRFGFVESAYVIMSLQPAEHGSGTGREGRTRSSRER